MYINGIVKVDVKLFNFLVFVLFEKKNLLFLGLVDRILFLIVN